MKKKLAKPPKPETPPLHVDIEARLQGLIEGTIKSTSDVVDYFVQQIKEGQKEFFTVREKMETLKKEMSETQARIMELKGQFEKYMADLKEWDQRSNQQ